MEFTYVPIPCYLEWVCTQTFPMAKTSGKKMRNPHGGFSTILPFPNHILLLEFLSCLCALLCSIQSKSKKTLREEEVVLLRLLPLSSYSFVFFFLFQISLDLSLLTLLLLVESFKPSLDPFPFAN